MAVGQYGNNTHVGHTQTVDTHETEVRVNHGIHIVFLAHLEGSSHVPAGRNVLTPVLKEILIRVRLRAGHLTHIVLDVGLVARNPEGITQSLDGRASVERVFKEFGIEMQRNIRVGRLESDLTTSLGVEEEDEQAGVVQCFLGEVGNKPVNREMGQNLIMRHCLV